MNEPTQPVYCVPFLPKHEIYVPIGVLQISLALSRYEPGDVQDALMSGAFAVEDCQTWLKDNARLTAAEKERARLVRQRICVMMLPTLYCAW